MIKKPYIIGICGGTCSGKSTLTDKLEKMFNEKYRVTIFRMDRYFKKISIKTIAPITRIEYVEHNHPDALELESLYIDFSKAILSKESEIIIIEGLFAFHLDWIREQLDLKVFIDLKSDERIYRRIKRWMDKQTIDEIALRYLDTVRFRHDEFVEPSRWHADLIINGVFDVNKGTEILHTYVDAQMLK